MLLSRINEVLVSSLQKVITVALNVCISAHSLPMYREKKIRSMKKVKELARADPTKSHRPDLPMTGPGRYSGSLAIGAYIYVWLMNGFVPSCFEYLKTAIYF